MWQYVFILLAVLYFLFPYDILPDFLPSIGRLDDILLMAYLYWVYHKKYKQAPRSDTEYGSYAGDKGREESSQRGGNPAASPNRRRDPHEILGTSRNASLEEIKHAYRVQANKYHPDKVSHLGEDFQQLAKERFQDIQWAYEQLVRGRT